MNQRLNTLKSYSKNLSNRPGVYCMKNTKEVVIYVGKAKNLRSRASSYFLKAAAEDQRTANWVQEIADIERDNEELERTIAELLGGFN